MPTITSNGTGGGNWSATTTWNGGAVPIDDDTVVIASGDTVIFNVDTSGFANGINGLTITGTLKVSTSTSSYMKMKAATYIGGAGTFNIGESGDAIPFAVKFTLTGGAGWYIKCDDGTGLTVTVYGAEPTYNYIYLSGNEAIGQTELSVATDVRGDIWAVGDTVIILDEERVIAAAGIAETTITITAGLTAAKVTGDPIILITRNVRILAAGTPTALFATPIGSVTIGGGEINANNITMFAGGSITISGGALTNASYIGSATIATINGGTITDCSTGAFHNANAFMSGGLIAGCSYAFRTQTKYCLLSGGLIYGCIYAFVSGFMVYMTGGIINKCTYAFDISTGSVNMYGGTVSNCTNGLYYAGNAIITGGTFTGNTYHLRQSSGSKLYGITLTGGTENYQYASVNGITEIFDYGGADGAYKAWTRGGIITSQTSVKPTGYTQAYLMALESTTYECFRTIPLLIPAGKSVSISVNLRKSASMSYLPRAYLLNSIGNPIFGATPVDTFTMTNSTDTWESDTFTIDNSASAYNKEYTLWFVAKNASGNVYSAYDITTQGGSGGGSVKILPYSGKVGLA